MLVQTTYQTSYISKLHLLEIGDWELGIGDWGLGIALLVRTLRERLRSVTRDWGLGIALLVRTLRERLRSVTRDWGLGIGLIYSLLITHYSLLLTPYYWGLGIGSLNFKLLTPNCILTICHRGALLHSFN
ncbi:MAG: hypothetical protein HEQ19_09655 [Gloeotrichia echinulata CP02]